MAHARRPPAPGARAPRRRRAPIDAPAGVSSPCSPKWCLLAPLCCRTFLGLIACVSTHLQLGDGAPQPPWPATTAERNAHASQPAGWHASGLRPAQLPCAAYPRFRGQFQLDGSLVRISMHLQLGDGAPQPPQFAIAIEHHQQWARI